jgi:hypothetical protein
MQLAAFCFSKPSLPSLLLPLLCGAAAVIVCRQTALLPLVWSLQKPSSLGNAFGCFHLIVSTMRRNALTFVIAARYLRNVSDAGRLGFSALIKLTLTLMRYPFWPCLGVRAVDVWPLSQASRIVEGTVRKPIVDLMMQQWIFGAFLCFPMMFGKWCVV